MGWGGDAQMSARMAKARWDYIGVGGGMGAMVFVGAVAAASGLDALGDPGACGSPAALVLFMDIALGPARPLHLLGIISYDIGGGFIALMVSLYAWPVCGMLVGDLIWRITGRARREVAP